MDEIQFDYPISEDSWNLEMELLTLLDEGLIETCGFNEEGDALMRITDKGRGYFEAIENINDGDK